MEIKVLFIIGLLGTAGYLVGRGFIKLGLTGILGYLIVGFILGPVFKLNIPKGFGEIISSFTLSLVGYTIGISFSFDFLKEMGKKMVIVLIVEVIVTSLCVFFFIYLISKNLPLSILLSSLSSATAPAGTIAVLREWKAKGSLT
ncbi:MAG: transporter, partial [Candidatus Omnitrophota bacterium]